MEAWGIIEKSKCWFRNLLNRQRYTDELHDLGRDEVARIAQDLGLTESELHFAATRGDRTTVALHRLLEILHLDRAEIERREPEVYRDLVRVCMQCAKGGQCKRGFERREPPKTWPNYCPNAMTLRAILSAANSNAHSRTAAGY